MKMPKDCNVLLCETIQKKGYVTNFTFASTTPISDMANKGEQARDMQQA
jgi:hypothetical protein